MDITTILDAKSRHAWRKWLSANHAAQREIWLLLRRGAAGSITYLDAVEEAICFGWIDGIAKRHMDANAQRFTPRRARSNWTELNKERARRLIRTGKMTEHGLRTLPELSDEQVRAPPDVVARLQAAGALEYFQSLPSLYLRVRLGYIDEMRNINQSEYDKRLAHFVDKTVQRKMFGNWDDSGMPRSES